MKELNNCNCLAININSDRYIFDYINYKTIKVDEEEFDIFESLIKYKKFPTEPKYKNKLLKIIIQIKRGLFFTEEEVKLHSKDQDKYNAIISFPIIHKCNLGCRYCFADSGENYKNPNKKFNKENFNGIMSFLNEKLDGNVDSIRIEFVSGGEPLIDKDSFMQIIDYIKSNLELYNIKSKIFVVTNGTTLDIGIKKFFEEHGINLGISMDGPRHIHNYHRPFKDGTPSYDHIMNNIDSVFDMRERNKIWFVSVVTSRTSSLEDILRHNISTGSKSMEMRLMRGNSDDELALNEKNLDEFKKLYSSFAQYLKDNPSDILYILNDYDTFGKIIKRLLVGEKIIYRCQAGKSKFSFTANGDIYPCDSFVGNKKFKMGNIWDDCNPDIMEKFKRMSVNNIGRCKKCGYRYLCGGDCYYNYYLENSYYYCEFSKHICNLAIDLLYKLKESNVLIYNRLLDFSKVRYRLN